MGATRGTPISLRDFFEGHTPSRKIFDRLRQVVAAIGPSEIRVTRSQVAFRRRKASAWARIPTRYLRGEVAPLVLMIGRLRPDTSLRLKEVVKVGLGRFAHHL